MVNELGMPIMCMNAIILTMPTHLSLYRVNAEISSALTQLPNMDPKELQEFHRKYQLKFKSTVNTNPGPVTDDVLYRIIYEDGDDEDMYDVECRDSIDLYQKLESGEINEWELGGDE